MKHSNVKIKDNELDGDENDIIFVNIWNKENDGKLRLTRQKPILKDTFKEMEKSNNFSLISNIKTKNFLGENFYKSNVFVPQTPRPVGGVGSTGLDQSNIRQNYLEDNNNLLPYLGSEVWKNMFHPNTTVLFYRGCPQIISCTQKLARKILIKIEKFFQKDRFKPAS